MNHLKTHQTNPTTAQYRPVQSNTSTAQYSQVQPIPEPDPKPELFGQTRPEPDPKSKSPTRHGVVVGRLLGGGRVGGRENNWPTDWDKIGAWRLPECSRLPTRDVRVCGICHSFPRKFKAVVYCWALQRWSNRYVFFREPNIFGITFSGKFNVTLEEICKPCFLREVEDKNLTQNSWDQ